ncbi:MAG: domain S-box-containing protein [Frankiales bacterium]|nr:domain S-box-containing protein [Frankiales bacterium]
MTLGDRSLGLSVDFARLFAALPSAYVVLDPALVIVAVNDTYLLSTGRTREDLIGRPLFEVFPPTPEALDEHGRLPVQLTLERVRDTGVTEATPVLRHDVLDPATGEMVERHWLLAAVPVLDDEGRTALVVQRTEDVTDFVRERERGRQAHERGEEWRLRVDEVEADLFAQARELAAALKARDAAARQAAALAEVALALTSAQTVEEVEEIVVGRGLAALGADGGAVTTPTEDGRWRITVNAALGDRVQAVYGVLANDDPLPAVWTARTGHRLLLPTRASGLAFTEAMAQVYVDTRRAGWAFLPLSMDARCLGSLAVAWVEEHEPTSVELELMDGFAAQCAQALLRIEAARAERTATRQVRRLAEELQQALLTPPPEPDHLHVVARYRAAAHQAQIGGDWYDSFQQPDGATMLVIGDVVGHDGLAAARMGQLRGLLRALAYDADGTGHDTPGAILTRVEHAARGLAVDTLATVVLARVERIPDVPVAGTRLLRWSNAGHPPPLLLRPDGSTELLDTEADLLLGVDPTSVRRDHTVELPVGTTLLFFTDGLVERRGASLDDGLATLRGAVADLAAAPLDELCDTLLARLVPEEAGDDIALLAVRGYPEDEPRPAHAGPHRTAVTQPEL